jgi:DNA-binding protein H-NS
MVSRENNQQHYHSQAAIDAAIPPTPCFCTETFPATGNGFSGTQRRNDTVDANMTKLETMTEPELRELIRSAQQALDHLVAQRAKTTLREIRRLAAEVGFEVSFAKADKAVGGKAKEPGTRGKAVQKYRNPDNPNETWSGRGRPPKWVQAALATGQDLGDLAIDRASAAAA